MNAAVPDPAPALSTGDFLSIAAICTVIVGAIIAPLWAHALKTRKLVKALETEAGGDKFDELLYRKVAATTTARGLAGASNSLEFLAGMLQRIFEHRLDEVGSKKALEKLQHLRSEVERAWMELRLLTGDRAEQTSALQQLERLGDRRTLRSVELLLRDDNAVGVEKGQIEETLDAIRERVVAEEGSDDSAVP